MKKFLALILSVLCVLSLAACSKNKTDNDKTLEELYNEVYNENGYFKDIKASDYVTIDSLDNIELDWTKIDNKIREELEFYKPSETITDKDRVIVDGDFVNVSYVGYIDGKTFSGGSKTDVIIEPGSTDDYYSSIELFIANELVGHNVGEKLEVTMTLSEDNKAFAGKEATFEVTINSVIEYTEVEWNDAFVKEHYKDSLGITTIEEAEKILINDELFSKLYDAATFSENIPENLIKWIYNMNVKYLETVASQNGMTLEEYLNYYNVKDLDELYKNSLESYTYQVKVYLFTQALAEHFNYVVSDADIDLYIVEYNKLNSTETTKDELVKKYGLNYLKAMIMYNNMQEKLSDRVDINILNKD